jgi:hypothetical protein
MFDEYNSIIDGQKANGIIRGLQGERKPRPKTILEDQTAE